MARPDRGVAPPSSRSVAPGGSARRGAPAVAVSPSESALGTSPTLQHLMSLQRSAGNHTVARLLARHAAAPGPVLQRTPTSWAADGTAATVAGFTGSVMYWQPVADHVAAYGRLAPGDVAGRLRTLANLETAIARWRTNQASNLWLSTTDRAKAAALTRVANLIAGERHGFYGEAPVIAAVGAAANGLTTVDLGTYLDQRFCSAQPERGLAVAAGTPEDRLRAALQIPGHEGAVRTVLTMTAAGVPAGLAAIRATLVTLSGELTNPHTAGVTGSDAGRETAVEVILTPAATRSARAAAVLSGGPAPTFVAANYYQDLTPALHQQMLSYWAWAGPMETRPGMDTAPGGHVEGIATEAKARVDALYGRYGSAVAPSLTFSAGTLEDRGTIVGDAYDMARWMVREGGGGAAIGAVQTAHHSFEDAAAARVIEDRLISHYSGRSAPTAAAEAAAMNGLSMAAAERTRRLQVIDRMWPGVQSRGQVSVAARQESTPRKTRALYWGLFKTMIHEYLHTTENATYGAWYRAMRDSHHVTTYQEGFTDLFTLRAWQSVYPHEIKASEALRKAVQGPTDGAVDMGAVGGAPGHYAELAEAQKIEGLIGAANMKAGYFRGDTAVLGGTRLPR